MQKVKIVTDSTCDLPDKIVEELAIIVVPLKVFMDDATFTAGIDLTAEEFYDKMPFLRDTPSTTPPSPALFFEAYEDAASEAETIVSIHISRRMSFTIESAEQARSMLPMMDIRIFDSFTTGASLGLVVLMAAWAVNEGLTMDEVCDIVKIAVEQVRVIGFPSTLKYLVKGGRIGRARGLVGRLLGRVPILTIAEGETSSLTTVPGAEGAMDWMIEHLKEEGLDSTSIIALTHGNMPNVAEVFRRRVEGTFGCRVQYIGLVGPVVGSHLGPGSLFFTYIKK
ncbi:MAG: DegV family protein [Candidatus Heimdallarchaeota archaeon]